MKNVTTGVEIQLTDAVVDHLVDNMSAAQRKATLRRVLRELRDAEAVAAELRVKLAAAAGFPVDSGVLPPAGEPVQLIVNARRGPLGDRWVTDTEGIPPGIINERLVAGWRSRWPGTEDSNEAG